MEDKHIVKKFDRKLDKIKAVIAEMGELVAHQIEDATALLGRFDAREVERIALLDRRVNGLHKEVHDRAELLIARRQPMALDLRETLAPINIAGEFERIGDHAKSTAKRAHIINSNRPDAAAIAVITEMSTLVQAMLSDVLLAYANDDIDLAAKVRAQDQKVDELNKALLQRVIQTIPKAPKTTEGLIHSILISRNFERIGDHIVNIARYVHQIVTSEDLKASD